MRITITLSVPHGERLALNVPEGICHAFFIESPYLVSAGQKVELHVTARVDKEPEPKRLPDARGVVSIDIGDSFFYVPLPSTRPLQVILRDVVQHGVDFPHHEHNCSCMDQYSQEISGQVFSALPVSMNKDRIPYQSLDDRSRISWVLSMIGRKL